MKRPYYIQYDEDSEPEFAGFANSSDEIISEMVENGTSYLIRGMTTIDEITEDMLDQFEDDDEYEKIKEYFERK